MFDVPGEAVQAVLSRDIDVIRKFDYNKDTFLRNGLTDDRKEMRAMRFDEGINEGNDISEIKEESKETEKVVRDRMDRLDKQDRLADVRYEKDDTGKIYKVDGELIAEGEYTVNGHTYYTDDRGRIKACDAHPKYTEDGSRNLKDQKESGGEDRLEKDDGGHIVARILNGPEGSENLVAMRDTINRGDYKKMENEISDALQDNKEVTMHIELEYQDESRRPSKIKSEYQIEDKKTEVTFDNIPESVELLETMPDLIEDEDLDALKEEIDDMKADGAEVSVTSVKVDYNENGEPSKVTVGIRDESVPEKTYKVYEARKETEQ